MVHINPKPPKRKSAARRRCQLVPLGHGYHPERNEVWIWGLRFQGLGFRVWDSGFKVSKDKTLNQNLVLLLLLKILHDLSIL